MVPCVLQLGNWDTVVLTYLRKFSGRAGEDYGLVLPSWGPGKDRASMGSLKWAPNCSFVGARNALASPSADGQEECALLKEEEAVFLEWSLLLPFCAAL